MLKSKEYDYNIYVVDGVVRLSAYEVNYLDDPKNPRPCSTNTDKWITLEIPMTMEHYGEIAYLLENPKWHIPDEDNLARLDTDTPTELERRAVAIEGWQDFDTWVGGEEWYDGLPTQRLKDWLDGLPDYTPTLAHQWVDADLAWQKLSQSTEFPATAEVACANCEATYTIGKSF